MRPCRSSVAADQRVDRRRVGHVERRGLGAAAGRAGSPPRSPAAFSPRAAATTCAPRAASSSAMPRPMPRDAPVTIATLSSQIEQVEHARTSDSRSLRGPRAQPKLQAPSASLWIFLTRPLSTRPGPTSTYVVTPSDARRRTTSSHRTGADTCRTSASIAAAASRFGSASTLATTGTRGSLHRQRAQLGRQPLLGRLHQRAVERRAHRQRHRRAWRRAPSRARRARCTAAAAPAITTWPGAVDVRRADHLALGRLLARAAAPVPASSPRMAAIAPCPTGTASCM